MTVCASMHMACMLECMAGPSNTEQQVMTYLFLLLLPTTIYVLCLLAYPTKNLIVTIQRTAHWRLEGKPCANQRKRVKRHKTPIKRMQDRAESQMLRTYFLPAAFASFRVG